MKRKNNDFRGYKPKENARIDRICGIQTTIYNKLIKALKTDDDKIVESLSHHIVKWYNDNNQISFNNLTTWQTYTNNSNNYSSLINRIINNNSYKCYTYLKSLEASGHIVLSNDLPDTFKDKYFNHLRKVKLLKIKKNLKTEKNGL